MSMFKKSLFALTAVAVMTAFVGCGDGGESPVAPPTGGGDTGGGTGGTGGAWINQFDSATVKFDYDSSNADSVVYQLTLTDKATEVDAANAANSVQHYSIAHLMLKEDGNLSNLESVIIGYKVGTADDSLALGFVSGYTTDFGDPDYNYFTAILTTGKAAPGTMVYDTLTTEDIKISWGGANYADGTTLKASGFLAEANALTFQLEEPSKDKDNVTKFELAELKLIGTGIGTAMGQTVADTAYVLSASGWSGMGGSYNGAE